MSFHSLMSSLSRKPYPQLQPHHAIYKLCASTSCLCKINRDRKSQRACYIEQIRHDSGIPLRATKHIKDLVIAKQPAKRENKLEKKITHSSTHEHAIRGRRRERTKRFFAATIDRHTNSKSFFFAEIWRLSVKLKNWIHFSPKQILYIVHSVGLSIYSINVTQSVYLLSNISSMDKRMSAFLFWCH